MTDEHTRCPGCNRILGHEPDCPVASEATALTGEAETIPPCAEPMPMYAISEAALGEIEFLMAKPDSLHSDGLRSAIRAARENGPLAEEKIINLAGPSEEEHATAVQQRAYLLAQVGSLILRLAGEKVAAGLLDLPAASVYADRERAVVNAGLAQIAESNKEG